MGTPEMVVKRARPCSSRLMPVGAPIGFSGAFSRVGAKVFSAHAISATERWRPSKTSAIGLSTTWGFDDFFPDMLKQPQSFDDMGTAADGQHYSGRCSDRWVGRLATGFVVVPRRSKLRLHEKSIRRNVGSNVIGTIMTFHLRGVRVPMLWRISSTRRQHGESAATGLRGHLRIRDERNSCK